MLTTSRPLAESALIAASRPEPGPFTNTSTYFNPCTRAALVAVSAAICAAYGNEHGGLLFDANINDTNNKIKRIIGVCRDEVQATFKDEVWKNMLKKSAEYLAVHSSMPKNKMNELYDEIPDEYKVNDNNDSFYRDKLKNF